MKKSADILPQAVIDLDEQVEYIAQHNPKSALRLYEAAQITFQHLVDMPELGSRCEFSSENARDVRMWPIRVRGFKNHIIFFRPSSNGIQVVRILHAARDFEAIFS